MGGGTGGAPGTRPQQPAWVKGELGKSAGIPLPWTEVPKPCEPPEDLGKWPRLRIWLRVLNDYRKTIFPVF